MKSLLLSCLLIAALSGCDYYENIDSEVFIKAETDCTLRGGLRSVSTTPVPASNGYYYYTAYCKDNTSVNSGVKDE
jgi:hypothetical protein